MMEKSKSEQISPAVKRISNVLGENVLEGKSCVIFCSESGFSKEIGRSLANSGVNLGLIDLSPNSGEELEKEFSGQGVEVTGLTLDSPNEDDYKKALTRVKERLGGVNFLICSYYPDMLKRGEEIGELSMDEWDEIFTDWVEGYFHVTRAALPYLRGSENSQIIFMNSLTGYTGEGEGEGDLRCDGSLYECGCSSGLTGILKSMSRDIIPMGIRVNGIALDSDSEDEPERVSATVALLLSGLLEYSCGEIIRLY